MVKRSFSLLTYVNHTEKHVTVFVIRGVGWGEKQYKLLKSNRFHPVTQPALPIIRSKDCPTNEFEALRGKDRNQ